MGKNWILIISCCFFGCINQEKQVIEELIPKDSFINILIDIEDNQKLFKSEEIDLINTTTQDSVLNMILERYNYSYYTYEKTILFYVDRPDEMLEILHEVKDSLAF